jgi:hypothetical protein
MSMGVFMSLFSSRFPFLFFLPSIFVGMCGAYADERGCTPSLQGLDAQNISMNGEGINLGNLVSFCEKDSIKALQKGHILSYLAFLKEIPDLSAEEWAILRTVAPLTSFHDEIKENNVTVPDLEKESPDHYLASDPDGDRFKVVMSKVSYLVPKISSKDISPALLASPTYHQACQPGYPKKTQVLEVDLTKHPNTFRINKELFSILFKSFSMTVQMKASEIEGHQALSRLAALEGNIPISKAILLERTKNDITQVDGSKVVKSVQIYREVTGGVYITNYTIVMNDQLPGLFSSIASYYGSKNAAKEAAETANRTRQFFLGSR